MKFLKLSFLLSISLLINAPMRAASLNPTQIVGLIVLCIGGAHYLKQEPEPKNRTFFHDSPIISFGLMATGGVIACDKEEQAKKIGQKALAYTQKEIIPAVQGLLGTLAKR